MVYSYTEVLEEDMRVNWKFRPVPSGHLGSGVWQGQLGSCLVSWPGPAQLKLEEDYQNDADMMDDTKRLTEMVLYRFLSISHVRSAEIRAPPHSFSGPQDQHHNTALHITVRTRRRKYHIYFEQKGPDIIISWVTYKKDDEIKYYGRAGSFTPVLVALDEYNGL